MTRINRKISPPVVQATPGIIQEPKLSELKNKVPVFTIDAGSEEIMKLEFIFNAGQIRESVPLQASSVNMLLSEGSVNYPADEINSLMDYYGTFFSNFCDRDHAGLSIAFVTRHIEKIIELCSEILLRPAFPAGELDTLMKKRLQLYKHNRQKVQVLSTEYFFESVFGKTHPYGKRINPADFRGLTPAILRDFHNLYYTTGNMAIIASGKIHPETTDLLNRYFGYPAGENQVIENALKKPEGEKSKRVFVNRKNSLQSSIKIGSRTVNKRDPDYPGLKVVDTILGGFFGSRLMKNIREDKGYTYGISSSVTSFDLSAYIVIGTETGVDYTERVLHEIYGEIEKLQKYPAGRDELEIVRNYMLGEMVRMFDGPFLTAEAFRAVWEFGLGNSFYYKLAEKIKTIDPDEIMHLARTYYNIDNMYEIVVGKK